MAGQHGTSGPTPEHEIHIPGPSISPPLIALGVAFLGFGVLFGLPLIVLGVAILAIGLVTWLIDDASAYAKAPDQGHH